MKKSKLSLGLVTTFVASLALSGCSSSVSGKDHSIVTFTGHNGETYDIVTEAMYNDYLTGVSGLSTFYDKVLETLIRYEFEYGQNADTKKKYPTIVQEAENNVKSQKENAKNSDDYDAEWQSILDSNGVEDEDELKEKFIYQIEQAQLEDWFLETEEPELLREFIGIEETGANQGKAVTVEGYENLVSRLPYHIRHILVKIDTDGNNYGTGSITEAQANKLFDIANLLKAGQSTFGGVAKVTSDDSSKDDYGDVGIMTNKADSNGGLPMFAEFQLGIYIYDALIKNAAKNFEGVNDGLALSQDLKDYIASNAFVDASNTAIKGLVEVPYSVFEDLGEYSDKTNDKAGMKVASGKESAYPRNLLYNKYLNHHNPFIITNAGRTSASASVFDANANKVSPDKIDTTSGNRVIYPEKAAGTTGFKYAKDIEGIKDIPGLDDKLQILTDERDNVIIGLRSASGGVHFIIVERSIFDVSDGLDTNVSLAQYYTTKVPSDTNYPKDDSGKDKKTYVNFINTSDKSEYETRAKKVRDAVKSFDPTYKYRLYEWLLETYKNEISFNSKFNLDKEIANYVAMQREENKDTQVYGMQRAWENYIELIEAQNESRLTKDANDVYTRVLPECCVVGFNVELENLKNSTDPDDLALYAAYQKGGMCYYGE